ncbi:MAG TPA: SUMF1/EgtB/PvdO family nonheme iron enzyme, partial [Magnetospirillum sp.]|nr:SUMF1/EgtB/PvdO family nonheme iron enzyme [Magnetospirillum sp.]
MRAFLAFLALLLAAPASAAEPFRDCPDCPEMVALPAGSVRLGDGGAGLLAELPAFALGRTEITVAQYGTCVAEGACRPHETRWPEAAMPMTDVTAKDAEDYAAWLSVRTGRRYRLPGEAEWEYAAKAGTDTPFPWGAAMEPDRAICQHCDPRFDHRPAPVASTRPNPWGLSDM